jgi:hypothetical protein
MSFEKNRREVVSLLNERFPNGVGCEIGVLRGEFTKFLLENWTCKHMYLVDLWEEYDGYDEKFHNHNLNYEIMERNLKPYKHRITVCKGYSDKVVSQFPNNMFDFVYVDANHSYEGCKSDMNLYWDKLKSGGLLMGDDYHLNDIETLNFNNMQSVFGVTKAVKEFAKEKKLIYDISYEADWMYDNKRPGRNFLIQKP